MFGGGGPTIDINQSVANKGEHFIYSLIHTIEWYSFTTFIEHLQKYVSACVFFFFWHTYFVLISTWKHRKCSTDLKDFISVLSICHIGLTSYIINPMKSLNLFQIRPKFNSRCRKICLGLTDYLVYSLFIFYIANL